MSAFGKTCQILFSQRLRLSVLVVLATLQLSACERHVEKSVDIRPVRVIEVMPQGVVQNTELAGEVRPRVESRLGFRVAGKILARKIDVGSVVKKGQLLMELDPSDLQLAQSQARAALTAAEHNRDLARADQGRFKELYDNKFVSLAVLDTKEGALKVTQANVDQARAALDNQRNQAGYSRLTADVDGVVVGLDADVGQVVAPGTVVVRLAKLGETEVQFGIPEDRVELLRSLPEVAVRLWANPGKSMKGKIREISPAADPITRTYTARVSLPDAGTETKLGMTAYVSWQTKGNVNALKLPLNAMYQEKGITSVWVVENGKVRLVPVTVGGVSGNEVLIAGGLVSGQKVVTAGVHVLKPGQQVNILAPDGIGSLPSGPTSADTAGGSVTSATSTAAGVGK